MSALFFSYRPKKPKQSFILAGIRDDFNDVCISSQFLQPLNEHFPNVLVNDKDNFIWLGITKSPLLLTEKAVQSDDKTLLDPLDSARSTASARLVAEPLQPSKPGTTRPQSASALRQNDKSAQDKGQPSKERAQDARCLDCEVQPGRFIAIIPHRDGQQLNRFLIEAQESLDDIRFKLRQEKLDAQFDALSPRVEQHGDQNRAHKLQDGLERLEDEDESISKSKKAIEKLVVSFLTDSSTTVQVFLQKISKGQRMAALNSQPTGFNMLIGELGEGGCLYFYSNTDSEKTVYEIQQGEYCFDCTPNILMGTPSSSKQEILWRTAFGFEGFLASLSQLYGQKIQSDQVAVKDDGEDLMLQRQDIVRELLGLFERTEYADEQQDSGLDPDWERKLSALRILTEVYSTRQSFVMSLSKRQQSRREIKEDTERARTSKHSYWPHNLGIVCKSFYAPDTSFLADEVDDPDGPKDIPQLELSHAGRLNPNGLESSAISVEEPQKYFIRLPDHKAFFERFDEKNEGVLPRYQDSFTRQTCFDVLLPVRDTEAEKKKQAEKLAQEAAAAATATQASRPSSGRESPVTGRRKGPRGSRYSSAEVALKRETHQEVPPKAATPEVYNGNVVLKVSIAQLVPIEKPPAPAPLPTKKTNIRPKR